jgi:hypothetical protein
MVAAEAKATAALRTVATEAMVRAEAKAQGNGDEEG